MEQFSLNKWLENPSRKVVTRDGREVEILKTNCKGKIPMIVLYDDNDVRWVAANGTIKNNQDTCNDLFFADEEPETIEIPFGAKDSEFIKDEYFIPEGCKARIEGNKVIIEKIQKQEELTEFEKEVKDLMNSYCNEIEEADITNELAKEAASNLLDLARKELQPEFDKEMDNLLTETDKVVYQKGQQDALKSLPKWKKATENMEFDKHVLLFEDEDSVIPITQIFANEYYIKLDDLKTLPKEEPISDDLDFQTFAEEMHTVFALPSSETKNTEEDPLNWEYAIARHFAEWKDEQLKQTREDAKSLHDEISDCIDRLVKSRLSKNGIGESNALQQMESIMVKTQQFLQTI